MDISRIIQVLTILIWYLINSIDSEFSYWGCIKRKAVHKIVNNFFKDVNIETTENLNQCLNQVGQFSSYIFYTNYGSKNCIGYKDLRYLQIPPRNIGCKCKMKYGWDYKLICEDNICDFLTSDIVLMDDIWRISSSTLHNPNFRYNLTLQFFPKCVPKSKLRAKEIIYPTNLKKMYHECYYYAVYNGYDYFYVFIDHNGKIVCALNFSNNQIFHLDQDCLPCDSKRFFNDYITCGSTKSASLYCVSEVCLNDYALHNQYLEYHYYYFGCIYDQTGFLSNFNFKVKSISDCFFRCKYYDLVFVKQYHNTLKCTCRHLHELEVKIQMNNLTCVCDNYWMETNYGSIGYDLQGYKNDFYAIYCQSGACLELIRSPDYIGKSIIPIDPPTYPPTIPPTNPSSSPSIIDPTEEEPCQKCPQTYDSRGFLWPEVCIGEILKISNCPDGESGYAEWICGLEGRFEPEEPIRENCISNWINHVKQLPNPKNITTEILSHIDDYSNFSLHITSGTLIEIVSTGLVIQKLISKNSVYKADFLMSVLSDFAEISNILFQHELAWLEMIFENKVTKALELINSSKGISYTIMETDSYKNQKGSKSSYVRSKDGKFQIYLQESHKNEDLPFVNLPSESGISNGQFLAINLENSIVSKLLAFNGNESSSNYSLGPSFFDFSIGNKPSVKFPERGEASFTFDHELDFVKDYTKRICVYWDAEENNWSSEGCELDYQDYSSDHTTCKCNHFTIFGVLFDVSGKVTYSLSLKTRKILSFISWTFSALSLISSIISLLILHKSKLPKTPRIVIQKNRSFNFIFLYIMSIIGVDQSVIHLEDYQCRFVAVNIHFFGLTTFFWTALEGRQMYRALILGFSKDIDGKYTNLLRYVFGYGISLLIVAITFATTFAFQYENVYRHSDGIDNELCWLKEGVFIYAFLLPALAVIIYNSYVFFRVMKISIQSKPHRSRSQKIKQSLKSWIIFTYLLGLGWAIGFLVSLHPFFIYIVIICNSSNGIFMFLHTIVFDEALMIEVQKWFGFSKDVALNYSANGHRLKVITSRNKKKNRVK